jgi:predicted O-methyltransferase YrrM
MRRALKQMLVRLASTSFVRQILSMIFKADPELAVQVTGPAFNRSPRFSTSEPPQRLEGFEDLAFLFANTQLNHGIIALTLDEAAYLYRLVRSLRSATIAEIGRYKGGSTFLIAAAMDAESELTSYDLRVKLPGAFDYAELDRELSAVLARYALADRVHIVVADSKTAIPPERPCDLIFIDGDHRYEGVKADFEHWRSHLAPGGHLLFHDAARRPLHSYVPDVGQLVDEVLRSPGFRRVGGAGSIVHLQAVS